MKFLADENIHGGIVAWLRASGHDVLYAAEMTPGSGDETVLELASREDRVLITDDKDFGELVFRRRLVNAGVILVRLSAPDLPSRLGRLGSVWPSIVTHAAGAFTVISDTKVRVRPMNIA